MIIPILPACEFFSLFVELKSPLSLVIYLSLGVIHSYSYPYSLGNIIIQVVRKNIRNRNKKKRAIECLKFAIFDAKKTVMETNLLMENLLGSPRS